VKPTLRGGEGNGIVKPSLRGEGGKTQQTEGNQVNEFTVKEEIGREE